MNTDESALLEKMIKSLDKLQLSILDKERAIEENNKKTKNYQTITIAAVVLAGLVSLITVLNYIAKPINQLNQFKKNQQILQHYVRDKHPETKIENGGFLEDPFRSRGSSLSSERYRNGIYVPDEFDKKIKGGSE